ncbi:MAG TPA: antitoxin MazE5 [Acidimicrobiales bacterium]|nr:antitoxin MazE5 [Acidimicrobiales bacterium]
MSRVRVSTTVDSELLEDARRLRSGANDATLLDEALSALIALNRAGEIDAAYAAYDQFPVDQADEWGSLGAFRGRVAAS